ncbi:XRE family transcriptional regulator [Enterococcus avium]|uniref:XRE family transcriptional regulator n=1 Tax=Enterococcus avium TaxID=33945 RepID=UPI002891F921|nr:XRE family transcriptional regulator [Enterococcus avium]MDT2390988.1 XRE family transcriptional regulator [Enterococcus avium]MDT2461822.1 XRE family transcriptional regulator [Enterococcus avium]
MESIGQRIRNLREMKNMTQTELSQSLGMKTYTTVSKWESDDNFPKGRDLKKLSELFGVSSDYLLGLNTNKNVSSIETLYNQLEKPRQTKVYNFAEEQLEEQQKEKVLEFPNKEKIPTVHNSASAANPTELAYGDTVVEEEEFERVPNNADFAVPIIGDSMEPVIRNGQFVFVKEQPDVEDGEIAIVELDGDGVTCKEIYKDYENQTIILRSINDLYEDRIVSPEQIRIIGKVVF